MTIIASTAVLGGASCGSEAGKIKTAEFLGPGAAVPTDIHDRLAREGWSSRVGDNLGVWVSVERQLLVGIRGKRVAFVYPCSTAAKGVGSRENSYQTPLGWHRVDERFGDGMPIGAVFKGREYQDEIWRPGDGTDTDLVLTRIMWLRGLERGKNAGPGIDSHDRYIYIHGTPAEDKIGAPASHGCVRLKNADVIEVFDKTRAGTRVLITKW